MHICIYGYISSVHVIGPQIIYENALLFIVMRNSPLIPINQIDMASGQKKSTALDMRF